MAKPPVIEDKQLEHMLKATAGYSRTPERDVALLLTLYGTALATTELATLTVSDYLEPDGAVKVNSSVRHDVAHNGEPRPLYWSNRRVVTAIDKYLAWRLENKHGATVKKGAYRGLDPASALFLTDDGKPYTLTTKRLASGVVSYSCNTLGAAVIMEPAEAEAMQRDSDEDYKLSDIFLTRDQFRAMPEFAGF